MIMELKFKINLKYTGHITRMKNDWAPNSLAVFLKGQHGTITKFYKTGRKTAEDCSEWGFTDGLIQCSEKNSVDTPAFECIAADLYSMSFSKPFSNVTK